MREAKPTDYLIRVDSRPAARDQVLVEGNRVTITPTKIEGAIGAKRMHHAEAQRPSWSCIREKTATSVSQSFLYLYEWLRLFLGKCHPGVDVSKPVSPINAPLTHLTRSFSGMARRESIPGLLVAYELSPWLILPSGRMADAAANR